eukprot:3518281-Rhodomonas_salina.1
MADGSAGVKGSDGMSSGWQIGRGMLYMGALAYFEGLLESGADKEAKNEVSVDVSVGRKD